MAASVVQDPFTDQLNATHRCDRCGAQAYVRAGIIYDDGGQGELLFCGHHGKIHAPKLLEREGTWLHDETDRLYKESALIHQATTEV